MAGNFSGQRLNQESLHKLTDRAENDSRQRRSIDTRERETVEAPLKSR